jgi:hypothetical protein
MSLQYVSSDSIPSVSLSSFIVEIALDKCRHDASIASKFACNGEKLPPAELGRSSHTKGIFVCSNFWTDLVESSNPYLFVSHSR